VKQNKAFYNGYRLTITGVTTLETGQDNPVIVSVWGDWLKHCQLLLILMSSLF